jgi:hypothetical protein
MAMIREMKMPQFIGIICCVSDLLVLNYAIVVYKFAEMHYCQIKYCLDNEVESDFN